MSQLGARDCVHELIGGAELDDVSDLEVDCEWMEGICSLFERGQE